jgi:squalene synthase HpnC
VVLSVAAAYAACARLASSHYENFPVASRLLPRRMRPHVAAVYAFARLADDIADEGEAPVDLRHARLDEWLDRLRAALADTPAPSRTVLEAATAAQAPAVFTALAATARTCDLPRGLLEDLVSAFRQDVTVTRYASWPELRDYCRRSANPVGRLVLRIGGWRDAALDEASDALCTALQLTNFWQDLAVDWSRGRLYVPAEVYERTGATPASLDRCEWPAAWQEALAICAAETRASFQAGRTVCDGVSGRLRWELRGTWLGGVRILDRLEAAGFDVFSHRPTLGAGDVPAILWNAVSWRP